MEKLEIGQLEIGQVVKFNYMDDFLGREHKVIGKVIGDHEDVKKRWPIEMGEADEGMYLIFSCQPRGVERGYYAIHISEVLEK